MYVGQPIYGLHPFCKVEILLTANGEILHVSTRAADEWIENTLSMNKFRAIGDLRRLAARRMRRINEPPTHPLHLGLDGQPHVLDPQGALQQTHSRVYNSLNRLIKDIGAAGQTTQYGYDNNGNLTTLTDPLNQVATNTYDTKSSR